MVGLEALLGEVRAVLAQAVGVATLVVLPLVVGVVVAGDSSVTVAATLLESGGGDSVRGDVFHIGKTVAAFAIGNRQRNLPRGWQ